MPPLTKGEHYRFVAQTIEKGASILDFHFTADILNENQKEYNDH